MKTLNKTNFNNQLLTKNVSIMKKVFLNGVAIAMSLMLFLTSCSKEQELIPHADTGSPELMYSLNNINNEYQIIDEFQDDYISSRDFIEHLIKIAATDARAYLETEDAKEAALASLDKAADGFVSPGGPSINTQPYAEITPQNPNNHMDYVGADHNAALEELFKSYTDIVNGKGEVNYSAVFSGLGGPIFGGNKPFGTKYSTSTELEDAIQLSNYNLWELKKMKVITKQERDILLLYKKGMRQIGNLKKFYNYTESFENKLAFDTSISDASKDKILGFISIAKHSRTYWANKKL